MFSINLVQFTQSSIFCRSIKQVQTSSPTSKVRPDVTLGIQIASLAHFLLLNSYRYSPNTTSIFFSTFFYLSSLPFFCCVSCGVESEIVVAFCSFWLLRSGSRCNINKILRPLFSFTYSYAADQRVFPNNFSTSEYTS